MILCGNVLLSYWRSSNIAQLELLLPILLIMLQLLLISITATFGSATLAQISHPNCITWFTFLGYWSCKSVSLSSHLPPSPLSLPAPPSLIFMLVKIPLGLVHWWTVGACEWKPKIRSLNVWHKLATTETFHTQSVFVIKDYYVPTCKAHFLPMRSWSVDHVC